MRDVAQETLLPLHKTRQPCGEQVDRVPQPAEFIPPLLIEVNVKVSFGNLLGGARELGDGTGQAAHQRQPEQGGEEQQRDPPPDPGPHIKKQSIVRH